MSTLKGFVVRSARPSIRSTRATSVSSASGRSRSRMTSPVWTRRLKRKIQAGPQSIWRYADFLPFDERPPRSAAAGLHPAGPRRATRRAARHGRGLDQERRRQSDALLQGPGRRGRDRKGEGARLRDGRLCLDRESGERRCSPRRGRRSQLLRLRPRRPRGAEAARDRCLRTTLVGGEGQLRRRQPPVHRALRDAAWAFVNVNLRPYYAEGSKTIAFEIVEQLGWRCPTASSARSLRGRCSRRSARASEWLDLGLVEGELPAFHGAQAEGCNPVSEA